MRNTTLLQLDWETPDASGFSEEADFPYPEASTTPAQQKELEEFLREFQEGESAWEVLDMQAMRTFEAEN